LAPDTFFFSSNHLQTNGEDEKYAGVDDDDVYDE
jgi:hypothetical protein